MRLQSADNKKTLFGQLLCDRGGNAGREGKRAATGITYVWARPDATIAKAAETVNVDRIIFWEEEGVCGKWAQSILSITGAEYPWQYPSLRIQQTNKQTNKQADMEICLQIYRRGRALNLP
jgi:hypothetical protein